LWPGFAGGDVIAVNLLATIAMGFAWGGISVNLLTTVTMGYTWSNVTKTLTTLSVGYGYGR